MTVTSLPIQPLALVRRTVKAKGIKRPELAAKIGYAASTLEQVLSGLALPSEKLWGALLRALDLPLDLERPRELWSHHEQPPWHVEPCSGRRLEQVPTDDQRARAKLAFKAVNLLEKSGLPRRDLDAIIAIARRTHGTQL